MLGSALSTRIRSWLRDYDKIQSFAVILIYIQIFCSLIGSLGALYNGVLLINLGVALFALVAIESSSQSLGRTYAVLLFCTILLDIAWFILFTHEILHISTEMYRLGVSYVGSSAPREADDLTNSFLNPATPDVVRNPSGCGDVLGGSIYDPTYYSSPFEDGYEACLYGAHNHGISSAKLMATAETSHLVPSVGKSSQAREEENTANNLQRI